MNIDKSQIRRILVITLSNVGDIILTTPVIKTLKAEFPGVRIDVMVGPRGIEIFEKDPNVFKLITYDKHMSIGAKRRLQLKLKKLKYDIAVDLRNTVFPLLIAPKFKTAAVQHFPLSIVHAMDKHLYRLRSLGIEQLVRESYLHIPKADEDHAAKLIMENGITGPIVLINPGAKSHLKRWTASGFAELADSLARECKAAVIFIGLEEDRAIVDEIIRKMKHKPYNFVNKTNIRQLAGLLKRSTLLVTNDSAPLHLACAVGAKVLAIFGPTDPKRYGPTGELDSVVSRKLHCSPCEEAKCAFNYECMRLIGADEVFDTAKMMIEGYG